MHAPHADQEWDLRYTVYVRTTGNDKKQRVAAVGMTIAKALYLAFGDRFRMVDHRSEPIIFDPDAHDWGFGEA